jgi:folate-binding protein YgfZ
MRKIFKITGSDRLKFLHGLVTRDVPETGLGYAALLTPQGKYLADFFLWQDNTAVWLDVAEMLADDLAQRLTLYRLRSDVQIVPTEVQVQRGTGCPPEGAMTDPRDAAMGWRLYGDAGGDDGTDWDALRVARVIPESGIELVVNESYILEMGFERLNGVDFRKGCFVGQEIVARMKHKTELKKGLMPVQVAGQVPVGTTITADGKPAGTLYTQSGGAGLAYVRFDRADGPMQAGEVMLMPR